MDTLVAYGSSSDEDDDHDQKSAPPLTADLEASMVPKVQRRQQTSVNPTPAVNLSLKAHQQDLAEGANNNSNNGVGAKRKRTENRLTLLSNNPQKSVLYQPVQGPVNDDSQESQRALAQYRPTDVQANVALDETSFQEQRHQFQRTGRAQMVVASHQEGTDSNHELVRTTLGYDPQRLEKFAQQDKQRQEMQQMYQLNNKKKRRGKRKDNKDDSLVEGSDDEVSYGVWGPPSKQEQWQAQKALTSAETGDLAPEQMAEREYIQERNRQRGLEEETEKEPMTIDRVLERKMAHLLPPKEQEACEPSTTFHGTEEYDYQGRSWIAAPPGSKSANPPEKCRIPKKCVAKLGKSTMGIHRIRLFPGTGHLLLSGGLDGTCQVWSVPKRQLMRSYKGHNAAVRDMQFNHSGQRFVSASFDRHLRLWDTESGNVAQTFGNGKVPYCVQFYPRDDAFFVVGCSDNRIVCYHTETGELTQEYNHHLGPVNSICFVDSAGGEPVKMVTSSDDKKILVWEWDIGVPIKYLSDPTMQSIPCLSMHPSLQYICGQSLDNTICCMQTSPKIKISHKKKFSGHIVAGYACEVGFSPDNGRFLLSGDGNGALFIWDFKLHKILQKFRAHDKPAMSVAWHPLEPSTVFTCSWDGTIKVWE